MAHVKFEHLGPVGDDASSAYLAARQMLAVEVDQTLAERSDVGKLIGGNPLRMMFDNHRNHAKFIGNLLKLNHYEMLVKTLP